MSGIDEAALAQFESRFQSPDALRAARQLIEKAQASGLTPRAPRSAVTAFEFFDPTGKAPFSVIANRNHALVYLRQPALKKHPGIFDRATAEFGEVAPNGKGEYRWRVTHSDDLDRILQWLESEHAWPWRAETVAPKPGLWVAVPLDFEPRPAGKSDVFVRSAEPFTAELGVVKASDQERQAFFEDQLRRIAWHLGDDTIPVFLDFNGDRRRMDKGCVGHAVASSFLEPVSNGVDGYVTHVTLKAATRATTERAKLWETYSRETIPTLFGHAFNSGVWQQGFIVLGSDVFLLVTLDKSEHQEEHRYDDCFLSADYLRWQSQNRTTQMSKHGQIISGGLPGFDIHLFVRRSRKLDGKGAPFTYCGDLDFVSWEGERPITVIWSLRSPLPEQLQKNFGVGQAAN